MILGHQVRLRRGTISEKNDLVYWEFQVTVVAIFFFVNNLHFFLLFFLASKKNTSGKACRQLFHSTKQLPESSAGKSQIKL